MIALFVNAAILIVAAAVFHRNGHYEVAAIQDAYKLLSPLLGAAGASTLFAVRSAGLAARTPPSPEPSPARSSWKASSTSASRRGCAACITRSLAIIPTIIVMAISGERGTEKLLILSQVILSFQLSFAVVPAGPVHRRPQAHGRLRQQPRAPDARLDRRRPHRRAERMAARTNCRPIDSLRKCGP